MAGTKEKAAFFESFFKKKGPNPLIFEKPHLARDQNYRMHNLVAQHRDLDKLIEDNMLSVAETMHGRDDGIPTIRPDLGTTLIPSAFGLELFIGENTHPCLKEHFPVGRLLEIIESWDPSQLSSGEILSARAFYQKVVPGLEGVEPYLPDTQGIFDLAHLLLGDEIFTLIIDDRRSADRILDFCAKVFTDATRMFKGLLGEPTSSMYHGHGMTRGVWFPHCGARISEDSLTLLSAEMVEHFCVPRIAAALSRFGRGFLHFCGHRPDILEIFCRMPEVAVINLGNPELYDLDELFGLCGEYETVLFQHFEREGDETHDDYLGRIAGYASKHRTRCILIAPDCPGDALEQKRIVERWHEISSARG